MTNWKHIKTNDYDWDYFGDKHGRETSKVRTFYEGNQYIWEADLLPNYVAESHWHPYDIVQIFLEGEFIAEGEGSFYPGDIRWVKLVNQQKKVPVIRDQDFILLHWAGIFH